MSYCAEYCTNSILSPKLGAKAKESSQSHTLGMQKPNLIHSKSLPNIRPFSNVNRMFVYGTLKEGQPNHHHFQNTDNGKVKFVSHCQTVTAFPLVIATRWNLPFLVHAPGKGHIIQGEVYDVDDDMLTFMDDFEGHPDVYTRDKVKVILTNKRESGVVENGVLEQVTTECWAYFLKEYPPAILDLRPFACYDAFGDHDRPYSEDKDLSGPDNIYDALVEQL